MSAPGQGRTGCPDRFVLPSFFAVGYHPGMPRRRMLYPATSEATMTAARDMRRAAVRVCTEAPIGSPAYVTAGAVLDALDSMAEALTGRRDALHNPQHTAGG